MQDIEINFFGTNNFAAVILKGLINDPLFKIVQVITMPDRPVGRKKEIKASLVKQIALDNGLDVVQPDNLKDFSLVSNNLNIVADYGMIIPQKIVDAPKYGSINVHPSKLPKYRGASPIQSAILHGETKSAITIMLMDAKMDHGPILSQQEVEIDADIQSPQLNQKMAEIASKLLLKTVPEYINGQIKPIVQNDDDATFCSLLKKEDGLIDLNKKAVEIYNQFRAMQPWPGVYLVIKSTDKKYCGKKLKIVDMYYSDKNIVKGLLNFDSSNVYIGCANGSIVIKKLQLEGKKKMDSISFMNGYGNLNNVKLF